MCNSHKLKLTLPVHWFSGNQKKSTNCQNNRITSDPLTWYPRWFLSQNINADFIKALYRSSIQSISDISLNWTSVKFSSITELFMSSCVRRMWRTHSTDSSSAHSWQHRCDDPVCLHWWTRVQNRLGLIAIMNNACILAYAVDIHWFNIDYFNKYLYYFICTRGLVHLHLSDAFIQSDLQLHSGYTFSLVCVFPGNRTHNLLRCWRNALPLSHTGVRLFLHFWKKYVIYTIIIVLSYFEGTVNLHCYTSCTLTTLYCSKVTFLQCCHMNRYNKTFTKMWGVYSLL